MSGHDSLGDRMKRYEDCYRIKLMRRVPKILRIDGKAFHTFLKNAQKPYDSRVMDAMIAGAYAVFASVGGLARFAYIQSDECTIAINDALDIETSPWFDNNLQKMVSVGASLFTIGFNECYGAAHTGQTEKAAFDARAFHLPDETELVNNLIWRQQDAARNSVQQYGRSYMSHKEMDGLSNIQVQEKLFQDHKFNWNDAPVWTKRGVIVTKEKIDYDIPLFTADREYLIERYNPRTE